jgi:hypothetical protein
VKIQRVDANNRKKVFEVQTARERLVYPYAKLALPPSGDDRVVDVYPDPETGKEAFTYRLESGVEDTIHLDAVLEYHQDPAYLNEVLLHRLTVEAGKALATSDLAKREVARRLGTSASQLYRLLDPSHSGKSVGQMLALLHLLGQQVEVVVRPMVPKSRKAPVTTRRRRPASA